jgi:parvulin-like peptidyl-prolyl isomerase
LSPAIIESGKGLHIVRVLERQESKVVPFIEAQFTIREKIRNQRAQRYQDEYFSELRRRFPTMIIKERIDFNVNGPRTANSGR